MTSDDQDPEEEDGDEQTRAKRHTFLVLWWSHLVGTTGDRTGQLAQALADGKLTVKNWAKEFKKELTDAHTEASVIGRRLAGEAAPIGKADHAAGAEAWGTQQEFFDQFVKDLNSGRYGTPGEEDFAIAQVSNRSQMYARRMKGTVTDSFKTALAGQNLNWNLGETEHCDEEEGFEFTCEDLAKQSPKPAEEWETSPGMSDTPCRVYCSCSLETEDGKYSTKGI